MEEAYAVGITLALGGNIGGQLAKVGEAFEALNKVIKSSQMAVNELASGMRGLERVGKSAAAAWTQAAAAMERAARAAKSAGIPNPGAAPGAQRPAETPPPAPNASFAQMGAVAGLGALAGGGGGASLPPLLGAPGGPPLPPSAPFMLTGPAGGGGGGIPPGGGLGTASPSPGGPLPLNYTAPPGAAPRAPLNHGDAAAAMAGFGAVGYALTEFVKGAFEARAEVEHLQSALGLMGLTTAQTSDALKIATDVQQGTPGVSIADGLHIIKDLMAVTQNPKDALDPGLVAEFARAAVVLKSAGKGDAISELFKAMQAAELKGRFVGPDGQPDPKAAEGFLRNVITATMQTGGRYGPAEILQFEKSGGFGAAMLSDKAQFAQAIAVAMSLGAQRAGTGIQAFALQFTAGRMSDAGAKMALEMGIIKPGTDLRADRVGIGYYRIKPDEMTGVKDPKDDPHSQPFNYMHDILLPAIDKYNLRHLGKPKDDQQRAEQRNATAAAMSARIPGMNVLTDVIRNQALIDRDVDAMAKALLRGDNKSIFDQQQATDPNVKTQAFTSAMNGLLVALGGPIMDSALGMIKDLTALLNTISRFAAEHPDTARRIMDIVFAVGAFSAAMAILSGVFLVAAPMVRVLGFLAAGIEGLAGATTLFAAGGAAMAGITAVIAAVTALAAVFAGFHVGGLNEGEAAELDKLYPNRPRGIPLGPSGSTPMGPVRPQSYVPPAATMKPTQINTTVNMDGKAVARAVSYHQVNELSGPSRGTTSFDPRMTPQFPSASVST